MAHGDWLGEEKKRIRDAALDMIDHGISARRAISIILECVNCDKMEANAVERIVEQMKNGEIK